MNQLIELVQERFPGAELRVFHDGAGSFTRDDLHVVAVTKIPSKYPVTTAGRGRPGRRKTVRRVSSVSLPERPSTR
ncbi:MAG: hypothetical protein M9938_09125 [Solirubrobacterales bacterium]|nr:hypothetical protein [Solirubrobacterales bacterium]